MRKKWASLKKIISLIFSIFNYWWKVIVVFSIFNTFFYCFRSILRVMFCCVHIIFHSRKHFLRYHHLHNHRLLSVHDRFMQALSICALVSFSFLYIGYCVSHFEHIDYRIFKFWLWISSTAMHILSRLISGTAFRSCRWFPQQYSILPWISLNMFKTNSISKQHANAPLAILWQFSEIWKLKRISAIIFPK